MHNVSALTPKQEEDVGVEQLEAKEGKDDLEGERATIYKVAVEQLSSVVKHYNTSIEDSTGSYFKHRILETRRRTASTNVDEKRIHRGWSLRVSRST